MGVEGMDGGVQSTLGQKECVRAGIGDGLGNLGPNDGRRPTPHTNLHTIYTSHTSCAVRQW